MGFGKGCQAGWRHDAAGVSHEPILTPEERQAGFDDACKKPLKLDALKEKLGVWRGKNSVPQVGGGAPAAVVSEHPQPSASGPVAGIAAPAASKAIAAVISQDGGIPSPVLEWSASASKGIAAVIAQDGGLPSPIFTRLGSPANSVRRILPEWASSAEGTMEPAPEVPYPTSANLLVFDDQRRNSLHDAVSDSPPKIYSPLPTQARKFSLPLTLGSFDSLCSTQVDPLRLRVLLACEDQGERKRLKDALLGADHFVEVVTDGNQVLVAATAKIQFDFFLLSGQLPLKTGWDVAKQLRKNLKRGVNIVGLVAKNGSGEDQFLKEDVHSVWRSPVNPIDLVEALESEARGKIAKSLDGEEAQANEGTISALVVDDHAANRMLMGKMLKKRGIELCYAVDGLQACSCADERHFDIILMDCNMPNLDGWDATGRIRAKEGPSQHCPIVAVTANAMMGDREKCLACGMDDYMSKPVDKTGLYAMVDKWTRKAIS